MGTVEPTDDEAYQEELDAQISPSDTELMSRFLLLTNLHMFQWGLFLVVSLLSVLVSIWKVGMGLSALFSYSIWFNVALGVTTVLVWCGTSITGLVFGLARQEHILGTLDDSVAPFQVYAIIIWCIYALLIDTGLNCGFIYYVLQLALQKDKKFQRENPHLDPNPRWYTRQTFIQKLKYLIALVIAALLLSITLWSCIAVTTNMKVKLALYVCGMSLSTPIHCLKAIFQHVSEDIFQDPSLTNGDTMEKIPSFQETAYAKLFVETNQSSMESVSSHTYTESNDLNHIKEPLEAPALPPRLHHTKSLKAVSMILGTYEPYPEPAPSEHTVPFVYPDMYSQIDAEDIPKRQAKSYILSELGSYGTKERRLYL
jgi:hypothetical protein